MSKLSLPLTQIVQENLSILMTFVFSRQPLKQLVDTKFQGEWKYLRKTLFTISEQRAEKACIELAIFMRFLDDEENISEYLRETSGRTFGQLVMCDKPNKPLRLRDVLNKIIHASDFKWDYATENEPMLICNSREREKWERAEINIVRLAAFCGGLMS